MHSCRSLLMVSQHGLSWWLRHIRQETIISTKVYQDLWCHIVPLSHWVQKHFFSPWEVIYGGIIEYFLRNINIFHAVYHELTLCASMSCTEYHQYHNVPWILHIPRRIWCTMNTMLFHEHCVVPWTLVYHDYYIVTWILTLGSAARFCRISVSILDEVTRL